MGLELRVYGLTFGVWSLGFGVQGLGFRVRGGVRADWLPGKERRELFDWVDLLVGLGFRVQDFGVRVSGFGFRVSSFIFWFKGFGVRVSGFGFGSQGFGVELLVQGFRGENRAYGILVFVLVCQLPDLDRRDGRHWPAECPTRFLCF